MFLLTATLLASWTLSSSAQLVPPSTSTNSSDMLANVTMAFQKAQVVPDVVSNFNPVVGADVLFMDPATGESVQVMPDILLTMEQTQDMPQFLLTSNNTDLSMSNVSWVITIVDPDAPTPQNPNISQFLHFIGQDFVVDSSSSTDLTNATALTNQSQAVVEFFPPTPPAGSDPHRYVVLVYVQPDNFSTSALGFFNGTISSDTTDTSFRMNFSLTDFATNTSLGNPVAGNFFLVGPDNTTTSTPTPSDTSSDTLPFPSPTAILPSVTVPVLSQPPPVSSPTVTGSTDTTSGAAKVTSSVLLVVAGVLIVAFELL